MKKFYEELNSIRNSDDNVINKLVSICSLFFDFNFDVTFGILIQITYFLLIEPRIFLFPNIPVFGIGKVSPSSKRYQEINSDILGSIFISYFGTIIFLPILMILLIIKYHKKDFIILNKYLKTFIILFLFSKLGMNIIYAGSDKIKDILIALKFKIKEYQSTPVRVIDLKQDSKPKMKYSFKSRDLLNIGLLPYFGIDQKKVPKNLNILIGNIKLISFKIISYLKFLRRKTVRLNW